MTEARIAQLHEEVEQLLGGAEPSVEVLALERSGPEGLRLFIDSPDGVDLGLCERVTGHLRDLLEEWSLEVSSPGPERPLSKPEHFRRFIGRKVRVRTSEEIGGRRSFTGTLADAGDSEVAVEAPEGRVEIPLVAVHRSNLLPTTYDADTEVSS